MFTYAKFFLYFTAGVFFSAILTGAEYPTQKSAVGLVSSLVGVIAISAVEEE